MTPISGTFTDREVCNRLVVNYISLSISLNISSEPVVRDVT